MAKTEIDRAVRPSLLDRLTDEALREPADRAVTREESARAFKQSVQRDVEWLLNTRRTIVAIDKRHPQVRKSVHEYGIADTTGLAIGTNDAQLKLLADITDTLRRFEPRLANVRVRLITADQVSAPQVHFVIEATLLMDPSAEQVVFDTVLEIASGTYAVDEPT